MIRITGFCNLQNKYIVICILYQFLMWIQLWWWNNCICKSATDTNLMNFLITRNTITLAPINIQFIHISSYVLVVTWFDQTIVVHTICYLGGVGHCYAWQVWVSYFIYFICIHILVYFSTIYFTMHWHEMGHLSTKSSSQLEQLHRFLVVYNKAECESWPTGFPCFYFCK
jgi:hypothetical protein